MIVILTLCPSPRNLATCRVLVSKSPGADLRPVLHLLDPDVGGLAPALLGPLGLVELELAVVHDPADRRVGHRGHLDEVEVELPGDRQGLGQRLDAELLTVGVDEADFTGTDAVVDPVLCCGFSDDAASHLSLGPAVLPQANRWSEADTTGSARAGDDRPGARCSPRGRGGGQVEAPQWRPRFHVVKDAYSTSMSSLWTPSGEHFPEKEEAPRLAAPPPPGGPAHTDVTRTQPSPGAPRRRPKSTPCGPSWPRRPPRW